MSELGQEESVHSLRHSFVPAVMSMSSSWTGLPTVKRREMSRETGHGIPFLNPTYPRIKMLVLEKERNGKWVNERMGWHLPSPALTHISPPPVSSWNRMPRRDWSEGRWVTFYLR